MTIIPHLLLSRRDPSPGSLFLLGVRNFAEQPDLLRGFRRTTLQNWQHIAVAISKKLARRRCAINADFENDDGDDDSEQYEVPDDPAASHTTKTVEDYGVAIDVL
ncbi:hypothetical protein V502_03929 [Pseudogymnoascus sp. VKM F-4520 (FW-2644)]|nr:hypothetical protein V502_03929 [Pseudogymnoascus sp. VKM F-4520 (FW-2644)]